MNRKNTLVIGTSLGLLVSIAAFSLPAISANKSAKAPAKETATPKEGGQAPANGAQAPANAAQVAPVVDEKSEKVLRDMAQFYKNLKSVSMTMTSDMSMQSPTRQNQISSVFDVVFEKPNKFSMLLKSGKLGGTMVSDGDNLILYSPIVNKYIKAQAPENLSGVFGTLDYQVISGGFSSLSLLEAATDPDPYQQIMADVSKVEYIRTDKLNDVEAHHLKLYQKDLSWELWIESGKEPWIRRVTADMSRMFAARESKQELPPELKDVKLQIAVNYSGMKANIAPGKEQFVFTPPAEAKLVKSFFQQQETAEKHPLVDKPAPAFKLATLEGATFDLAEHKGKVVVLDFWASWCGPCTRALPILNEVTGNFKDKGVVFVAVNVRESPEQIQSFLKSKNLNVNVALDQDGKVGELYQVRGIPQTVVVGKDGTISQIHVGFSPNLKDSFAAELDQLISGKTTTAQDESKK